MKKILALILALVMLFALAACGQQPAAQEPTEAPAEQPAEEAPTPDTITVMVPPVSDTYQDDIDTWIAEFKELYPHLDVEVIKTS